MSSHTGHTDSELCAIYCPFVVSWQHVGNAEAKTRSQVFPRLKLLTWDGTGIQSFPTHNSQPWIFCWGYISALLQNQEEMVFQSITSGHIYPSFNPATYVLIQDLFVFLTVKGVWITIFSKNNTLTAKPWWIQNWHPFHWCSPISYSIIKHS